MPGEIATYLLGAQGGIEEDQARLYTATNPVLVRYLRVTTGGDPDALALDAWATALQQLSTCPADDDTWLEVVVGAARTAAAGSPSGATASASTTATPTTPGTALADPDEVDHAIELLRACPPAEADVLAMGVVANLGREATSRLTGQAPGAVLALVQRGHERVPMSFEELIAVLRAPGRPHEVADLQRVTPLMTAALASAVPTPAAIGKGAAWADAVEASLREPSLVELQGLQAAAAVSSNAVHVTAVGSVPGTPSRSARAGVGAAVWVVALGGMGAAAAMSGLLTAAVDGILGDHGTPPVIIAEGPVSPGTPSAGGGNATGKPPVETSPGTVTTGPTGQGVTPPAERVRTDGGGSTQPVSRPRRSTVVQIQLASYVTPAEAGSPASPTTPTTPVTPVTPTTPTTPSGPQTLVPRPGTGPVVSVGHGSAHDKDTRAASRAARAEAKAAARSARAEARAAHRAAKARDKGHDRAKASGHHHKGHDKAKASGHHHKGHDKAKASGHHKGHDKGTARA